MLKLHLQDQDAGDTLVQAPNASIHVLRDAPVSVTRLPTAARPSRAVHPVEQLQQERSKPLEQKQAALSNVYGTHFPLRLQMEAFYLARPLRLPGLHCEYSGLKTVLGEDDDLNPEDIYNDPALSEVPVDVHAEMEKRLFGKAL